MELIMERDWYGYLGVSSAATGEEIGAAVERLSRQASALATTAPERSQSLRETIRKIKQDLLSGPDSRQRYDETLARAQFAAPGPSLPPARSPASAAPPGMPAAAGAPVGGLPPGSPRPATGSRLARFLRTGWTCVSCGNGALPGDKFCTKCGGQIQAIGPDPGTAGPLRQHACAQCANPLGQADVFCSKCGARR